MIKDFSSPKITIWFPPEAGKRADVFIISRFCAGEDSNLHVLADTGTSSQPGYQLQHPRANYRFRSVSARAL